MPIYESDNITYAELDKIRRKETCKVCGEHLAIFMAPDSGKAFLACWDWLRTQHEGTERKPSRYEKEGLASLTIKERSRILTEQIGEEKATSLAKYQSNLAMTTTIATEIVETIWGDAPAIEKAKAILLCTSYQLNPVLKHIYLVGYKRWKDRKPVVGADGKQIVDWSIQIGIGATRLMAQRKHAYRYVDFTPRIATQSEINKILGETQDSNCIYGFCWIKDCATGAEAFGLRGIKKQDTIQGTEKGNTLLNMACIRAERQALDRQYPGEMPTEYEVFDERFVEPEYKIVDRNTGEVMNGEATELLVEAAVPAIVPPATTEDHICEVHGVAFVKKSGRGGTFWYAHELEDGGWCNEKKKKEPKPVPNPEPEASLEPTEAPAEEAIFEPDLLFTSNDLLAWVAENMAWKDTTSVRSWISNVCKIPDGKIDSDPEAVRIEVAQLQGWSY